MPISKTEFLNFATNKPTELEFTHRNQISRAYYAAYHWTNEHFDEREGISTEGTHGDLIYSLQSQSDEDIKKIGFKLAALKSWRERSDYKLFATITESDLKIVLIETDKLIAIIESR